MLVEHTVRMSSQDAVTLLTQSMLAVACATFGAGRTNFVNETICRPVIACPLLATAIPAEGVAPA